MLRSTLLRQSGLYALFGGAAGLIPVLVIPYITRRIAPSDFGIVGLYQVAASLSLPLIAMGMETAVGRRFIDRDQIDFGRYVTTALAVSAVLAVLVLILALAAYPWLASILEFPRAWTPAWVAFGLSEAVLGTVLVLLQMEERPVQHGWWRIARWGGTQAAILLALLCGWRTWQALVLMQTLAGVGIICACLVWMKRQGYLVPRLAMADARAALAYGAPLLPHMIGSAALVSVDRLLIAQMIGVAGVGVFAVGAQFGQVMYVLETAVGRAWIPWFYARMKSASPTAEAFRAGTMAALGLLMAAIVLAVGGSALLPRILSPAYARALPVFLWFIGAWTAHGGFSIASAYLFYSHRTAWISAATAITVLANIAFALWLIPRDGIVGGAQAAFVAYAIAFLGALALSRYFQRVDRAIAPGHPLVATKRAA